MTYELTPQDRDALSDYANEKPDSVIKHQKFEDLMTRYHGQIDNLVYAAEQICTQKNGCNFQKDNICPFSIKHEPTCRLGLMRDALGDHIEQHDITIQEDNTQAERKKQRITKYCEPCERTDPECGPCKGITEMFS